MTRLPVETVLADGTAAMIWPLLPTDGEALRHAFGELSPRSRRQRFLGSVQRLDDAMIHLLVDAVDGRHHIALILVVFPADGPEQPVGVARLVQLPAEPATADFAVTVADAWQGLGVGSALADVLMRLRPVQVRRLSTEVAADNEPSLALLRRLGSLSTRVVYPGVVEATVELVDDAGAQGRV